MRLAHGLRASGATDPYFGNVSLLLHGDGTNGSTSFPDSSNSAFTVTANGNAQVSTSVVKYGSGAIALDGNGDYLSIPDNDAFTPTTALTVECWMYISSYALGGLVVQYDLASSAGWVMDVDVSGLLRGALLDSGGITRSAADTVPIPLNTWTHCALVWDGSTVKVYKNGVAGGTTGTSASAINSTAKVTVGAYANGAGGQYYFNGYIDDVRITKNVARYTTTFTPPASSFPNR